MKVLLTVLLFVNLIFAINLQKPSIYNESLIINNWYMSEKLDGIRAYWDGKELFTKNGNKIFAPQYFTKDFPPFELDGELWTKRGDFENIQSIVLDQKESKEWESITYNIFEVPNAKEDFKARLDFLQIWLDKNQNKFIKIIPQRVARNEKELNNFLEEILAIGGEGVILKNPKLEYFSGRSENILKVKKFFDDEAEIIGQNLRTNGTLKSLKVKLKNGIIFNLGGGFTNQNRENPPEIGTFVTFKYYGFTKNGKPKFASFLRERKNE